MLCYSHSAFTMILHKIFISHITLFNCLKLYPKSFRFNSIVYWSTNSIYLFHILSKACNRAPVVPWKYYINHKQTETPYTYFWCVYLKIIKQRKITIKAIVLTCNKRMLGQYSTRHNLHRRQRKHRSKARSVRSCEIQRESSTMATQLYTTAAADLTCGDLRSKSKIPSSSKLWASNWSLLSIMRLPNISLVSRSRDGPEELLLWLLNLLELLVRLLSSPNLLVNLLGKGGRLAASLGPTVCVRLAVRRDRYYRRLYITISIQTSEKGRSDKRWRMELCVILTATLFVSLQFNY